MVESAIATCPLGHLQIITQKNSIFFFHFRCIFLQISHKKCFSISISILGRKVSVMSLSLKTSVFQN